MPSRGECRILLTMTDELSGGGMRFTVSLVMTSRMQGIHSSMKFVKSMKFIDSMTFIKSVKSINNITLVS